MIGSGQSENSLYHWSWDGSQWALLSQTNAGANALASTVTGFSDHTGRSGSPLAVALASFTADAAADGVTLAWETVSEQDNAGLQRISWRGGRGAVGAGQRGADPGGRARLQRRAQLHLGRCDRPGPRADAYYLLEDVDLSGAATRHGPLSVSLPGSDSVPNSVRLSGFGATGGVLPQRYRWRG